MALPSRLTLPSGARVELRARSVRSDAAEPRAHRKGEPIFTEALIALDQDIAVTKDGKAVDINGLALTDFHVLRAVLAKSGLVREEPITVTCRNCEEPMTVTPCEGLETGPWIDGELGDAELDATLPFGEAHEIPPIRLGRVRTARTITLAPRSVGEARPLFEALSKERVDLTAVVVRAMGVVALGDEKNATRIADALALCDDDAFAAVSEIFLAAHYPARLGCAAFCEACGARNDVDAPYERELEPGRVSASAHEETETFPSFEAFAERAQAIAAPLVAEIPGDKVDVAIDEGTPAVDDGGEPLLGSYVPPHAGDASNPARPPLVTVYYRTFRAMWDEDGPYDWDDELEETIEHELEHHVFFLRGHDPMDEEERAAIRDEAVRIVGRREASRRAAQGFAASVRDFLARTWPIWVIALLALAIMLATQR